MQKQTIENLRNQISKIGAKGKAWNNARRNIKPEFEALGITRCELNYEGCWKAEALSFAHSQRRRFITSSDSLREVVLACTFCHKILDEKPREETYRIVNEIISNRVDLSWEAA